MIRKIIQIEVNRANTIVALCDDGTLWISKQSEAQDGRWNYISTNQITEYGYDNVTSTLELEEERRSVEREQVAISAIDRRPNFMT